MKNPIIIKRVAGNSAEGIEYRETITPAPGFSVGQLVYRTTSGWALSNNASAATAHMMGVVKQVVSPTEFVIAGPSSIISVPGAGWTAELIGYVGTAGAITFTKPETAGLFRTLAVRTISATDAVVLDGIPEPADKLPYSDIQPIPPRTAPANFSDSTAPATPETMEAWAAALLPLLDIPQLPSWSREIISGNAFNWGGSMRQQWNVSANATLTETAGGVASAPRQLIILTVNNPVITWPSNWKGASGSPITQPTANSENWYWLSATTSGVVVSPYALGIPSDTTPPTLRADPIIASDGLSITFPFTESVTATDWTGWTTSLSGVTFTYLSGDATTDIVYTPSRRIAVPAIEGAFTVSYARPTNGIKDLNNNNLANITARAVNNQSNYSPFLYQQKFDGTRPSEWVITTRVTWNDSGKLKLTADGTSATYTATYTPSPNIFPAAGTSFWERFTLEFTTLPSTTITIRDWQLAAGTSKAKLRLNAAGSLLAARGDNTAGTGTFALGSTPSVGTPVKVYCWVNTRADEGLDIYLSLTNVRPASPTCTTAIQSGTTGQVAIGQFTTRSSCVYWVDDQDISLGYPGNF